MSGVGQAAVETTSCPLSSAMAMLKVCGNVARCARIVSCIALVP